MEGLIFGILRYTSYSQSKRVNGKARLVCKG